MPAPLTVTRTELALMGQRLRAAAQYLLDRPRGYGWHVAAGLVHTADRLDPEHKDSEMSALARNVNFVLDQLNAADAVVQQLTQENSGLKAQLAAVPTQDAEDAAAEARLAAEVARRAPVEAPPQPAGPAEVG